MLWRTVARSSSAAWLAPLLVGFVVLLLNDDLTASITYGYWNSALGAAGFALPFVAAACAGAGAWEGSRTNRGQVAAWAPARPALAIALPLLLPIVALGLLGMGTAVFLTATAAQPNSGVPPLGFAAMWLVVLTAHSMAGFLIGKRLPLVVGAPLALMLSFVITAYPASFEPLWLRHLVTGGASSCCALDQTPDWTAPLSATFVALGIIFAASVTLTSQPRRIRMPVAAGVAIIGLVAGIWNAYGLPAQPTVTRSSSDLQCSGSEPTVCVWPEVADRADMIRQAATAAYQRLADAGLSLPPKLTMEIEPSPGQLSIGALDRPTPHIVTAGVAGGLLPPDPPACASRGPFPGEEAFGPVAAWLTLTAGADQAQVASRYGEREVAAAALLLEQSKASQLAWYEHNNKALRDCTTKPTTSVSPAAKGARGTQ